MRSLYLLTSLMIFSSIEAFCQEKQVVNYLNKLHFKPVTEDYLFIQEAEITNLEYHEFLNWELSHKGKKAYLEMYPDTTVWRQNNFHNEPFVLFYFQHKAYSEYPVVGISWFQAQAYCQWKAARIMESKEFKRSPLERIIIRLPSEKEWMKAARGSLSEDAIYPWMGDKIRWTDGKKKDQGKIRLNCKRDAGDPRNIASKITDAGFITTPVSSYWPNTIGLYNICGNVAEWIEEKNRAKGGSWNSLPYNCRIDFMAESVKDNSSECTIGFRPALEIISYKTEAQNLSITLTPGTLERQVKKINDSLSAAIYETSNQLYNMFLNETKNITDSVHGLNWSAYTRYAYFQNYHRNPLYSLNPVVNITYESALHFCEWLTARYNQSGKRKYKEVLFRLPTEAEWELAAHSVTDSFEYPWTGPYLCNSKGCFLANFNPLEEEFLFKDSLGNTSYRYPEGNSDISRGVDGAIFTAPINAYYPNKLGLYNCSGNVAEMVKEKGISKGGSWTSSQYYIHIDSKEYYSGSNANLGFRFFMVVKKK